MSRGRIFAAAAGALLLALAGCGRSYFLSEERAAWRHDAEIACIKSGAVKIGVEQIDPIEGPGMCGMDFPFKVAALGEASSAGAMSYADPPVPPGSIPSASSSDMPRWPPSEPRYAPPPRGVPVYSAPVSRAPQYAPPVKGEVLRWVPGPQGIDRSQSSAPAEQPMAISPPQGAALPRDGRFSTPAAPMRAAPLPPPTNQNGYGDYRSTYQSNSLATRPSSYPRAVARPDDIPDDAIIPEGGSTAVPAPRTRPQTYNTPAYDPPAERREPARLGPSRGPSTPANIPAATLTPTATLACPLVSALDRWVSEGVQPAALHWFRQPVTEIHQIGSYSCREMIGAGGHGVSEHAFGNALDIAGFTLADGRKITVREGWHGTPEEQGFLHDVQLYACDTFVTVLAPGYNAAHYDHIHVDLMRRDPGYRPCRPEAIRGDVVAARVRARYANHHGPRYTGSIKADKKAPVAVPGADGYVARYDEVTGTVKRQTLAKGDADDEKPDPPPAARKTRVGVERDNPSIY
jgi:hypothetical protein